MIISLSVILNFLQELCIQWCILDLHVNYMLFFYYKYVLYICELQAVHIHTAFTKLFSYAKKSNRWSKCDVTGCSFHTDLYRYKYFVLQHSLKPRQYILFAHNKPDSALQEPWKGPDCKLILLRTDTSTCMCAWKICACMIKLCVHVWRWCKTKRAQTDYSNYKYDLKFP